MNKPGETIKALLVDDEPEAIEYLTTLIAESSPNVDVVATASDIKEAFQKITCIYPDLVFLDIQLHEQTGFDLIKKLNEVSLSPYIVFVTAYDQFAIDAFKANALDYLLKPVEADDLIRVLNKYSLSSKNENISRQLDNLLNHYQTKIKFATRTGYIFLLPNDIVYCKADGNYTEIFLNDGSKKVVCQNLKKLTKILPATQFIRISRFHIINELYLAEVNRVKKEFILEVNGKKLIMHYSSVAGF
ncbi:MAG: response regulator transcription factor [Prolixibacteraceae bacterium]|nr:response regulator transcription factor [Prolixibacteraceae bacterium]